MIVALHIAIIIAEVASLIRSTIYCRRASLQRYFTFCCRQIHPLYGEKAGLLGYCDAVGNTENFPPAPNIVVEGGRIEFVRPSQDGTTTPRRNTMSRGSQTFNEQPEKSDPAKVSDISKISILDARRDFIIPSITHIRAARENS